MQCSKVSMYHKSRNVHIHTLQIQEAHQYVSQHLYVIGVDHGVGGHNWAGWLHDTSYFKQVEINANLEGNFHYRGIRRHHDLGEEGSHRAQLQNFDVQDNLLEAGALNLRQWVIVQ